MCTPDLFIQSMTNSFDIIMAAREVLYAPPIWFYSRHIPVHPKIVHDEMDIWGRSNDDCEEEAKIHWKFGLIKTCLHSLDGLSMKSGVSGLVMRIYLHR
jgi:hypothetical protein